jgi:hypothetical protein
MVHLIGIIGAMLAACFTGASLYRTLIDRSGAPPAGTRLLTSLAVGSAVFGLATYVHGEGPVWIVAGVVMLVAAVRWGKLPQTGTLAGVIASLIYIYAVAHL